MSEVAGMSSPAVSTWDLLRTLGFVEDLTLPSDAFPSLSINFGNFKLSAIYGLNRSYVPVFALGGVLVTDRNMCEVECEMPPEVESVEQGKAWVTWCLDKAARGEFKPKNAPPWLAEGRQYFHLLPWKRRMAAYDARPHCAVDREWARIGLRTLGQHLASVDDETLVIFGFDGKVLTICCGGETCPMPAPGTPWKERYSIRAGALRRLPTRLRHSVEFSIWDTTLTIGNRCYKPIFAISKVRHPEDGLRDHVGRVLPGEIASRQPARKQSSRPSPSIKEVATALSAAEVLSRVRVLRQRNAQWEEILPELNPSGDPEVQQLLIEIRRLHMFAPHLGLGVIEDGCKRALASSPEADALAALREATRSQDPFVRD